MKNLAQSEKPCAGNPCKRSVLLALTLATGMVGSAVAADVTIKSGTCHDNSQNFVEWDSSITVESGAAFDLRTQDSEYLDTYYKIYITGEGPDREGALRNTGTAAPQPDDHQFELIEIWGDSLIKSIQDITLFGHYYKWGDPQNKGLQTWEHTLTLDFAADKSFILVNSSPWDSVGDIHVISGGLTFGYQSALGGENNHQNRKIVVTGQNSWLKIDGGWVYIKELEMSNGAKLLGDGNMVLHTGFKPAEAKTAWTGVFEIRTDGGTKGSDAAFNLDLSGLTEAWTFPSSYAVHFPWDSTQTTRTFAVKPGTWAMSGAEDHKIISWANEPGTDLTFVQDPSTISSNWELSRRSDGLYLKYLGGLPFYATRDLANNKWKFYDTDWNELTVAGLPTEPTADMTVCFSTPAEYDYLKTATFQRRSIMMRGTWSLASDMDLQGLDFVLDSNVVIDVKGHHLTMWGKSLGEGAKGGEISSSVAGGILELNVPQDGNEVLKNVTLVGGTDRSTKSGHPQNPNLKVWKTGAGRFSIEKEQTLLGVEVGDAQRSPSSVVTFVVKGGVLAKGSKKRGLFFGRRYSIVQVEAGARVDVYDRTSWDTNYEIAGNGPDGMGVFAVSSLPPSDWGFMAPGTDGSPKGCMHHITLMGDASVDANVNNSWPLSTYNNVNHELTFNGHTFTVGLTECVYWMNLVPTDAGKLVVGKCEVYGRCKEYGSAETIQTAVDMSKVDIEVKSELVANTGCFFNPIKSLKFDPEAAYRHSSWPEAGEYFEVVVHDAYRPSMNKMPQITLGAEGHTTPTLDLSTLTGTLDGSRLSFYPGSTVTVELGARDPSTCHKLISWSNKPADVTFVLNGKDYGRYRPEVRDDGLYLIAGLTLYVR